MGNVDLKKRLSTFIEYILIHYGLTQRDLAALLGTGPGRLSAYLHGKELPKLDVVVKLAEIGGLTVDDLLKTDKAPISKEVVVTGDSNIVAGGSGTVNINAPVHTGDVYQNTTIKRTFKYVYKPGDLTDEQASVIKGLVDEIVGWEKQVKQKPSSHAAVYNALKKRYKVVYYRNIHENIFSEAVGYLKKWKGRLMGAASAPKKAEDKWRKDRYKGIFSASKNDLKWTKQDVDNYILAQYGVPSIRDLTNDQLDNLYRWVFGQKRRK